jgi:hypothetical protein
MKESISFPEDKIPGMVKVIRKGLKGERDKELREDLEEQLVELEDYWKRMQEED